MPRTTLKTTVGTQQIGFNQVRTDMLVLGLYEDTRGVPAEFVGLDKAMGKSISELLKLGDFPGKANSTTVLYNKGKLPCRRVMLVGLGPKKTFNGNVLRRVAGSAIRAADKLGTARIALALHVVPTGKLETEFMGQAITEGAILGRYAFKDYLPAGKARQGDNLRVTLVDSRALVVRKLNKGVKVGKILAEGQNHSRMVANKPGNEINPPTLARQAQRSARQYGLRCKVYNDKQLAQMKMNAILAVGAGSASKPRLIMLEYKGRRQAGNPDAVVVGKAITFDSGGICIKPSANMEAMKFDKCGGCNVLGIMTAVAQLKLPLYVVGLIPAAENLPSQNSYRPGDIIRTYSGKTVEVQNTDAEGRMILSDALAFAARMKPGAIVDMATLTGACVIALGEHHAGLFSNDSALRRRLEKAADISGEPVCSMPSGPEYLEQMHSKIADLKNIGGRGGGPCTAAAFLGEFVGDIPWAHIDIAGVADSDKEKSYRSVGATGFGVKLLLEYLREMGR